MRTTDQYIALIEPQHADKPNFVATVALSVDVLARFQAFLASMPQAFDLDFAIGVQLDAVGVRVGRSRFVPYPIQNVFFSFDDPLRGFDRGIWKGPYDTGTGLYRLDDDTYRRLLRAKVLANQWDGSISAEQAIVDAYFDDPATFVFVQDTSSFALPENYFTFDDPARGFDAALWAPSGYTLGSVPPADMSITIGVSGKVPNLVDLALLSDGLIVAKPEAVTVNYAVTSVSGRALFGFDVENQYVSGFDVGAWGVTPAYIAANAV